MSSAGYELPLLLFAGFRSIIDELHVELARRGHQDMRPAHGFAMQAIGFSGATATEVGRRLGVSKQAAGKTVERLEALGYVEGAGDGADRRRKPVRLHPPGGGTPAVSASTPARQSSSLAVSAGECETPVGLRTNSIAVGSRPASTP